MRQFFGKIGERKKPIVFAKCSTLWGATLKTPDYLTYYFREGQTPFEVLSDLDEGTAEEILKQEMKINKQNKHEIDRIAAAIIVQRWLDQQI